MNDDGVTVRTCTRTYVKEPGFAASKPSDASLMMLRLAMAETDPHTLTSPLKKQPTMAPNRTGNGTADAGAVPASSGGKSGVDLDPFLSLVESRLRNPYSSLELSRLLTSSKTTSAHQHHVSSSAGGAHADTGADAASKEADNVILLGEVFDRMAKPVKLRSIVGLMGLEGSAAGGASSTSAGTDVGGISSSGNEKLNNAIWDILSGASAEDVGSDGPGMADTAVSGATNDVTGQPDVEDDWVRVLASLVQSAMFYKDEPQAEGERRTKHLEDVAEGIVRKICERVAVSVEADASSEDGETNTSTTASGSSSTRANLDPMHFVPQSFALLPPSDVKVCIPESASNTDFAVNIDAPILKVDADVEQSRADEETKELENRERTHRMAQQQQKLQGIGTGGVSVGGRGRGVAGRTGAAGRGIPSRSALGVGRGGRGLGRQSAAGPDTASLFIRSKKPTASTATLGRGTARALLGRGRGAAGPGGGRGAAGAGRGRGMGRGSAAAAVGKSLGVPTKKPIAMGNTSKRPGGKAAAAISGSGGAAAPGVSAVGSAAASSTLKGRAGRAMKASAGGMGGRSKMMMIDSAEVEKLNKEKQAAAAEETAQSSGKSRKRKIMEAAAAEEAAKRSKSITGTAVPSAPAEPSPQQASAAVEPPAAAAAPVANAPPVAPKPAVAVPDGLLAKSNKLSSADRSRVERFFSDRFNPTPDQTTYKMKLNEERSTDAETGQSTKETLYLELDYTTFGYKKTRKIKKK